MILAGIFVREHELVIRDLLQPTTLEKGVKVGERLIELYRKLIQRA